MGNIYLFSILTVLLSFITLIGDNHLLELLSHLRIHYLIASFFFYLVFLYLRNFTMTFILFASVILNASFIVPWYLQPESNNSAFEVSAKRNELTNSYAKFKILHFNLLSRNTRYTETIQYVNQEKPDFFIAQEMNRNWRNALESLVDFPYQYIVDREDNFGIALFSKYPWTSIEEKYWGNSAVPSLHAQLIVDKTTFNLVATHPLPPIKPAYYQQRNQQLQSMISELVSINYPILLVGDLNISQWSSDYNILSSSKLINARQGFGVHSTWPAKFGVLGIPIDHILISSEFETIEFDTGPYLGSDHLPIIATVRIKTRPN